MNDNEIAEILLQQSEEYKKLYSEHKELKDQLAEIDRNRYLAPDEELQRKKIQKQKLLRKDSMAALIREYRQKV